MINIHTHIFTLNHVPRRFIPLQWLFARKGRFRTLWIFLLYVVSGLPRLTLRRRADGPAGRPTDGRADGRKRYNHEESIRRRMAFWMGWWHPRNPNRKSTRMALFLLRGGRPSQADILKELMGYYPSGTRFAVHTIDFDYMGAGGFTESSGNPRSTTTHAKLAAPDKTKPETGATNNFMGQLEELARLKATNEFGPILLPFFCADPRRPDVTELAQEYLMNKGFAGIKLYPAMGFYPGDSRLMPLWEWAAQKGVPVMVHCSRNGPVYGRIKGSGGLVHPVTREPLRQTSLRQWAERYGHPLEYEPLLQRFEGLKICFSHFGGEADCLEIYREGGQPHDNWFSHICRLMKNYSGVYADISFSLANPDLMAFFHVAAQHRTEAQPDNPYSEVDNRYSMADKILFGSDFYMSELKRNERWFSINVRAMMGEESFHRIASINPSRFLEWKRRIPAK